MKGEVGMKTTEERLEIARRYNKERFAKTTFIIDGTLIIIRKPVDKKVQGKNWSHKGQPSRNAQVGVFANGEIGDVQETDEGNTNDITSTKYGRIWEKLDKEEHMAGDKGYEGLANYHANSHVPFRGKNKTPEQRAWNMELKELRIIVENSIAQIKKFSILKGVFMYKMGSDIGHKFAKLDTCLQICAAFANIHMRRHPIRAVRALEQSNKLTINNLCI